MQREWQLLISVLVKRRRWRKADLRNVSERTFVCDVNETTQCV